MKLTRPHSTSSTFIGVTLVAVLSLSLLAAPQALAGDATPGQAATDDAPLRFGATTVERTVKRFFDVDGAQASGADAKILADAGVTYQHILGLEVLPGGESVVVEAELRFRGARMRYPLKLTRQTQSPERQGWVVSWAPSPVYAQALINLVRSQMLPTTEQAPTWSSLQRMPGLPIIVTRQQAVTPFGEVTPPKDLGSEEASTDLLPSPELLRHVQRWILEVVEDAPGVANLDIIADKRLDWRGYTQVLMGTAGAGFFRVHIVTMQADSQDLGVLVATAPVFAEAGQSKGALILGMYPLLNQVGFRVGLDAKVNVPKQPCAPEMTFCVSSPADLAAQIKAIAGSRDGKLTHIMYATTGESTLEQVVQYLDVIAPAIGLPSQRVFTGYIQR